jgi:MFS family permease
MKEHGRKIFTLLWLNAYVTATGAFVILPYSVSYLVKLGMNEAFSNLSVTVGTAVAFFTVLLGAYISDYVGRLRTIRIGAVLTIVVMYPYFWLLNTLNPLLIVAAQALLYGIHSSTLGANSAVYTESFPTKYRSSGSGLAYQLAGLVAGLLVALLLPVLLVTYGVVGSWQPIAWAVIVLTIVAIVASYFVKETRGSTLE